MRAAAPSRTTSSPGPPPWAVLSPPRNSHSGGGRLPSVLSTMTAAAPAEGRMSSTSPRTSSRTPHFLSLYVIWVGPAELYQSFILEQM